MWKIRLIICLFSVILSWCMTNTCKRVANIKCTELWYTNFDSDIWFNELKGENWCNVKCYNFWYAKSLMSNWQPYISD